MSGLKWTRITTEKISEELKTLNIQISANTVGKLLKEMGFSLRANQKKLSNSSVPQNIRDEQFAYIADTRKQFASRGAMIISIDTKKKELIGWFKNQGQIWSHQPTAVNDHDFRSQAKGIAIPYGVYDVQANRGMVFVGTTSDTPAFSTDCLAKWYTEEGRWRYHHINELLILADCGGSNRSGSDLWKYGLQSKLCNPFGLTVTVCHYPPGTSKWNPIEHRLFSEISKNWAGRPLDSYETILNYLRTTTTKTGLKVSACLNDAKYEKGKKLTKEQKASLKLVSHDLQPKQNYSVHPSINLEDREAVILVKEIQKHKYSDQELSSGQDPEVIFA